MAKKDLSFYNKTERPWLTRLDRSSIVGHTTHVTSRIWFRMKKAGNYRVIISTDQLVGITWKLPMSESATQWLANKKIAIDLHSVTDIVLEGTSDFTAVVDIENLQPNTHYHYGIVNLDDKRWELGYENEHSFQTMPLNNDGTWDITFGLYSCHMPFDPKYPSKADASMWGLFYDELKFSGAKFVIGGGDQVYVDGTKYVDIWKWLKKVRKHKPKIEDMLSWYRDIYRGYWGFPDLMKVHRSFPNYMIWDDHEIMDGWGSYTKKELSQQLDTLFEWENVGKNVATAHQMFEAASQVYYEYQHSHNPKTDDKVYDYPFEACGADYYVLDMRGHRDFERKEDAILGEEQRKRFQKWVASLEPQHHGPIFIVSTVPVVHLKDMVSDMLDWLAVFGARDDVRDHWAHKHHRKEVTTLLTSLFSLSEQTKRPLVLLSGDVHIGGIFTLSTNNNAYPNARVYQVTSSAITYAAVGPAKMRLLAKSVAQNGQIGLTEDGSGSGFYFKNHAIFPQHNFSLIRYRTNTKETTHLDVELIGQSEDSRVKESKRFNLLELSKSTAI
jgi:alkaline phosphatase D